MLLLQMYDIRFYLPNFFRSAKLPHIDPLPNLTDSRCPGSLGRLRPLEHEAWTKPAF